MSYILVDQPTTLKDKQTGRVVQINPGERYSEAIYNVLSGGRRESPPAVPSFPSVAGELKFGQNITKRGVFMTATGPTGTREVFLRPNLPRDIVGNERYTYEKEWRPMSTEEIQGKGKVEFSPAFKNYANVLRGGNTETAKSQLASLMKYQ